MAKKYGYYAQNLALINITGFLSFFAPPIRWQINPDDSTIRRPEPETTRPYQNSVWLVHLSGRYAPVGNRAPN